jgi:bifunctional DNA-binding transcriptional regulator/antitoxin component of YhaV-PrlF toxin-antitoxin module
VLPQAAREALRAEEDSELIVFVRENEVVLMPRDAALRKVRGILRESG